jgi:DNA-binding protein HU-beta
MNKQQLVDKVAQEARITKTSAAAAIDSFFDGVTKALKKGQPITLVGFGTFKTANRKARLARNPQTGAEVKVPKRRVVRFNAGKALKSAVN